MQNIFLLWEKINSSKNIILINHIRMDPDAFWSLTAFYQILKKLDKNIIVLNDETPPNNFKFLFKEKIFQKEPIKSSFIPDLIISFDAASIDQLWNSYLNNKEIFEKTDFFVIDHHLSNPWFWKYNIIKTDYSSTCEIVYELIEELKYLQYMDQKIATALFSWIITDTNIFYNQNTSPNTHRIAWELMKYWADFRAPIFEFYQKKNFKATKLWWEILSQIKQIKTKKKTFTYGIVNVEMFEKTNTNDNDISWLVNEFLANISWSDVWFLLYPLKNWKNKASFRSKEIDISILCQKFWWWWHKLAAGFQSDEKIEDLEKEIINELKKL
jgi:phosphoesterase RecJ-like protein